MPLLTLLTLLDQDTGTTSPPPVAMVRPPEQPDRPRRFVVVVRNQARQRVGTVNPLSLSFTPRFNDVGEWTLTLSAEDAAAPLLLTETSGVLIYDADDMTTPLMSGPVGTWTESLTEGGRFTYTVSGPDDMVWLKARLTYQDPTSPAVTQTAQSHYVRSGPAESVMKAFVEANVGQTALATRRKLTVIPAGPSPRGANVIGKGRMLPGLLPLLQDKAATGGLGFTVRQSGTSTALNFDVYVPANRTATIRFGLPFGNLTEYSYTRTAPTTTAAVAGAGGQGTARVFRERTDATALAQWPDWRMETFIDQRQTTDNDELDQALYEELLSGGPSESVTVSTVDTPSMRLWEHYWIGDKITVLLPRPGGGTRTVQDVVREATITTSAAEGTRVVTRVGTRETTGTAAVQARLRKLTKTVSDVNTVD